MSVSASSTAPELRRPRWLLAIEGVQRPYLLMALWGVAVGLVTALALLVLAPHVWPIIESRSTGMRASLAVLNEGGPSLVGRHGPAGSYYPIALGDDPGSFIYFPWLGHLFGGVDPLVMLSYFYVVAVSSLAAVYPPMFYRLTGSLLAGLVAPLALVACMLSIGFVDIYWIPAWGMLALLPALYLLARDWPRFGLVALAAISLAAGWLSSTRSDAGAGILAIAAIVVALRRWRWWQTLPALALLAAVYMSTNSFDITAIRDHRDHQLGLTKMTDDEMTHHPLFHSAYIGLGYLSNSHGIRFIDGVANARVQQATPGTPYLSHQYEVVIRNAYFSYVRAHPLEALRQYGAKLIVAVADTGPYLLLVLLTMPAMILLGTGRRIRRLWVLLTIPAILVGFLQPMVAIPGQGYDTEVIGVLGVLGILGLCWALSCVEDRARRQRNLSFALPELRTAWSAQAGQPSAVRTCARISALSITVLIFACIGGYFIRQSSFHWLGVSPGTRVRLLGYVTNHA